MHLLTFSYSRLCEYPTHAVFQSSGPSRTLGTLELGLFRLPPIPDFLFLGSLALRIYRTSALLFLLFAFGIFELGIYGI